MSIEVEETLKRLSSHKGVVGIIIINNDGLTLRSTLPPEETENYSSLISQLTQKTSTVIRTIDDSDSLALLRIRSKKHEIMIAPEKDYILIVIQNPQDA